MKRNKRILFFALSATCFFGLPMLGAAVDHFVLQPRWGEYWVINTWWGIPALLPFAALWVGGSAALAAAGSEP